MIYPNGGTPPTTVKALVAHGGDVAARTTSGLAFTGSDVVGWVVIAVLLIAFGLLLWWAKESWNRLG